MKFSKMCDYKGKAYFLCRTGRRNCRILEPGQPYEKSFVVPIKSTSNKRPADVAQDDDADVQLEDDVELTDQTENDELADEFQPQ
jgi:hypothetical protein